jgi:hypothetical protein
LNSRLEIIGQQEMTERKNFSAFFNIWLKVITSVVQNGSWQEHYFGQN